MKKLWERLWPVAKLRAEIARLKSVMEEVKHYNLVLIKQIDKMSEHISIQNGQIERAREILNRQRVIASGGEL